MELKNLLSRLRCCKFISKSTYIYSLNTNKRLFRVFSGHLVTNHSCKSVSGHYEEDELGNRKWISDNKLTLSEYESAIKELEQDNG